jgi:hypothetical protein
VDSSAQVLAHVARAWDHQHPEAPFAAQEVIVTVPASFDEDARELTLEAATRAGLPGVVLLEEPQAAFYAWAENNARALRPGERVLVFDVGGGTTDFTLIAVGEDGSFERTAVGDHLLLGGDNVDLTLAKAVEARLGARSLDTMQWHGLVHACRLAKETLLAHEELTALPVVVSGRGARLIGGTLKDELSRAELDQVLMEGFFPVCERHDHPRRSRGGLHEFGLPYAADAAITRHLALFLTRHGADRIDAVLFNGGAMTPAALRRRVLAQLERWQPEAGAPRELLSGAPELAVAQGAAHYGLVRRGLGRRIGGGTPRAFYVGVGRAAGVESAVCLAPRGLPEGSVVELARDFELVTNRPVSFKLYSSSGRNDAAGALIALERSDEDLLELPPIVTALRAPGRAQVDVRLHVRMTELGTLEMKCVEPGQESSGWKLSFDMRAGGARVDAAPAADEGAASPRLPEARALVAAAFSAPEAEALSRLIKQLEEVLGAARDEWPTTTARALFDATFELEEQRKRSPHHEARWLNLVGFCLRPGTGAPLDDWRARQMWRIFNDELVHPGAEQCRLAWWIAWRRVAGGLAKGQQHQIYLRLAQLFLPGNKGKKKWSEIKPSPEEAAEMLRCLANMERLSSEAKIPVGNELLGRLETRKGREDPLTVWALGRLGARVPLYGPLNCVVPAAAAATWLEAIVKQSWPQPAKIAFSVAQLARRTGDRSRDLDDDLRARVVQWLRAAGAERAALLVAEVVALEGREEHIALGDTLPPGLRLVSDS